MLTIKHAELDYSDDEMMAMQGDDNFHLRGRSSVESNHIASRTRRLHHRAGGKGAPSLSEMSTGPSAYYVRAVLLSHKFSFHRAPRKVNRRSAWLAGSINRPRHFRTDDDHIDIVLTP